MKKKFLGKRTYLCTYLNYFPGIEPRGRIENPFLFHFVRIPKYQVPCGRESKPKLFDKCPTGLI
jgi:hypothetical protein